MNDPLYFGDMQCFPVAIKQIQILLYLTVIFATPVIAQSNLENLLEIGIANYPTIRASQLRTNAAQTAISYEQRDLIPRLSLSYQANLATHNNIAGMYYPGFIMPISGPVREENNYRTFAGSATSLLLTWNPFTFGKRSSRVQHARSQAEETMHIEELILFEFKVRFIEAYLNYFEFMALEEVQESEIDRLNFNLLLSRGLTESGLRPGVDSSLVKAELSKATIELLNIRNERNQVREQIYEYLTSSQQQLPEKEEEFLTRTDLYLSFDAAGEIHPRLNLASQQRHSLESELKVIRRNLRPDLTFWSTGFARGSSVSFGNNPINNYDGLNLSMVNYGAGFQISLPLLDFARTSSLLKLNEYHISALKEQEDQIVLELNRDRNIALLTFDNARESIKHTRIFLEHSEYSVETIHAMYEAGLIDLSEVLQSQYQLKRAEYDEVRSRIDLWRSLLYLAAVEGDIEIFLEQTR